MRGGGGGVRFRRNQLAERLKVPTRRMLEEDENGIYVFLHLVLNWRSVSQRKKEVDTYSKYIHTWFEPDRRQCRTPSSTAELDIDEDAHEERGVAATPVRGAGSRSTRGRSGERLRSGRESR
jgi:hypothetical protein